MSTHNSRIGIEFISVFNLPPVEMVRLAADLECGHISLALEPMLANPHGYAPWSLRKDRQLRRDVRQALQDHGVEISLGEGYLVRPGADIRDSAGADLEAMRELDVRRINVVSVEPDFGRNVEQFGALLEMAEALGMEATLEFGPIFGIADLQVALDALQAVGSRHFSLLVDVLHFVRSGATASDLATLEPGRVGYLQLCDVPLVASFERYMEEARNERLPPGQGELPLLDLLGAVRRDVVVGLEIPMLSLARAGVGPRERLRGAVAATGELLRKLR